MAEQGMYCQDCSSDPVEDKEMDEIKDEVMGVIFDEIMDQGTFHDDNERRCYHNGLQAGMLAVIRIMKVKRKEKAEDENQN